MQSSVAVPAVSKPVRWTGYVLSVLPAGMLVLSAATKFSGAKELVEGMGKLGWPQHLAPVLGVIELACTALYLIPQTSVLGAILLTGYLGGATATHLRVHDPLANVLTPVVLGAVLWLGLYLRDPRLRVLVPLRRSPS